MRSNRLFRVTLLVAVFTLLAGQDQCREWQETGALPGGAPAVTKRFEEKAPPNPPNPLACDTRVFHTVNISQQNVNCQGGFNYAPLFTSAKGLADGLAAATACPENCAPIHTWIERLTTACQGTTAGVILEVGFLCPRPNTPKPAGIAINANDPRLNGQPIELPSPQPPAQPSIGDVTGSIVAPVGCQPPEYVEFRYRERVPCGGAGFNFQPWIDRAESRAPAVCRAVSCAAGCNILTPPAVIRSRFRCRNPNEVEIRTDVQCCG
ncbi:MAG: hypothetical protein ACRD2J_08755 [Thermoanaerobaculia bacterium]